MNDLVISDFAPTENADRLTALIDAYLAIFNDEATLRKVSYTLRPFEEAPLRSWFLEWASRCFTCLDAAGRIAGFQVVVADPLEGFSLWGAGVRPDARRRGIGRALVGRAMRFGSGQGYKAVESSVFADNIPRLRLLLDMGFVPVAITHRVRADGGDLVRLARAL
jgi:ribosomal protein S18 acetylase RimI-like enzyme